MKAVKVSFCLTFRPGPAPKRQTLTFQAAGPPHRYPATADCSDVHQRHIEGQQDHTITTKGVNAGGQSINNVRVYDKQ